MNILFVTPPPYLPNRLHRVRSFDLISMLAEKHRVYLLGITTQKSVDSELNDIKDKCAGINIVYMPKWKCLLSCLLHPFLPFEVAYCINPLVQKQITNTVKTEKIDLIYLKRLRSAVYLPGNISVPVVLDTTDAMSLYYKRAMRFVPWFKIPLYLHEFITYLVFEKRMLKLIPNWISCSKEDKQYLEGKAFPENRIYLLPNSVSTSFYDENIPEVTVEDKTATVVFSGLMDKLVNIDAARYFVDKIYPLIKKEVPKARFFIVGPNPTRAVRKLNNNIDTVVTGYQEDIRKVISQSHVVVCPIRVGTGSRNKILQAWALGKPVVSTSLGVEGLDFIEGKHLLIADTPGIFASEVVELLKDRSKQVKIGQEARSWVKSKYSYSQVGIQLEEIIYDICSASS